MGQETWNNYYKDVLTEKEKNLRKLLTTFKSFKPTVIHLQQ